MLGSFLIFIFLLAIAFQSSPAALFAGAVVGLALSLALSLAIYRLGVRLDLKRFFTIVGAALMVVAAGLLANAIGNLQSYTSSPVARRRSGIRAASSPTTARWAMSCTG